MSDEIPVVCDVCDGDGVIEDEDGDEMTCPECNGTGEVEETE